MVMISDDLAFGEHSELYCSCLCGDDDRLDSVHLSTRDEKQMMTPFKALILSQLEYDAL